MKPNFKNIIGAVASTILCATMLSSYAAAEQKIVHVYSWADFLPQTALDAFAKESGMKVEADMKTLGGKAVTKRWLAVADPCQKRLSSGLTLRKWRDDWS